jgi:hypothetical protein
VAAVPIASQTKLIKLIIPQKIVLFITVSVRTSDPTNLLFIYMLTQRPTIKIARIMEK